MDQYNYESVKYILPSSYQVPAVEEYTADILDQTDTYFRVPDGRRLKIREQKDSTSSTVYAILYDRPDTNGDRVSHYTFYPIDSKKIWAFKKCFYPAMDEEVTVKKRRMLYMVDNVRIHYDDVEGLGRFIEIEVVIKTKEQSERAPEQMKEMISFLNLEDIPTTPKGYRELSLALD